MNHRLSHARALATLLAVGAVLFAGGLVWAEPSAATGVASAVVVHADPETSDRDGDGVADDDDNCPDTPGTAAYAGCPVPDTDNDGVYDDTDQCPSDPGLPQYDGCPPPDSDGDGITDDVDACPNLPGPYDGCPLVDFDGDGVTDDVDQCPDDPAPGSSNGCPEDSDGDGVTDDLDGCPGTQLGENVDSVGCSLTQLDSDNDGVDDEHDHCPATPSDTEVDVSGCAVPITGLSPAITGRAREGSTLTAKTGSVSPAGVTFTYRWLRDGSAVKGSTKGTFLLGHNDAGHRISVRIEASKLGTPSVTKTSPPTVVVSSADKHLVVPATVSLGDWFVVTATGFEPGAPAAIKLTGHRVWTGRVDARGIVRARVRFPAFVTSSAGRRVRVSTYKETVGKDRTATIFVTIGYG